jgi:hypothetical protein
VFGDRDAQARQAGVLTGYGWLRAHTCSTFLPWVPVRPLPVG